MIAMTQEAGRFPWGTGTQTTSIFEIANPDKAGKYEPAASDHGSGVGLHIKGRALTWRDSRQNGGVSLCLP